MVLFAWHLLVTSIKLIAGFPMKKALLLIVTLAVISGCATKSQLNLGLSQDFYTHKEIVVGVYMTELPKTDTHIVGAHCLLCYAVATGANSSLTKQMKTLNSEDLEGLDQKVVDLIVSKGISAKIIETEIIINELKQFDSKEDNFARRDFRSFKDKLNIDKLVVIDLNMLGAYRAYNGYFPQGGPMGAVIGSAYTIDLKTNRYELYEKIDFKISPDGTWDEPPAFPGVSNSFFQAIELTKERILQLF